VRTSRADVGPVVGFSERTVMCIPTCRYRWVQRCAGHAAYLGAFDPAHTPV